jgi:predicted transcriptional regulator
MKTIPSPINQESDKFFQKRYKMLPLVRILEKLYWPDGKSMRQIGEELGCTKRNVSIMMKKFGIPKRSLSEAKLMKHVRRIEKAYHKPLREITHEKYWKENKTQCEIALKLGVACSAVHKWMKKYKIPTRTPAEARTRFRKEVRLTSFLKDYIDGLLLGDGSLAQSGEAVYEQEFANSKKEWMLEIKNTFENFGFDCTIYASKRSTVRLRTKSHPVLRYFRGRWYPQKKKLVPRDISLSPIMIKNWYLGDGKLDKDDAIILYTECFNRTDVEWLADSLTRTLNIGAYSCKNEKGHYLIKIRVCDSEKFLVYIGENYPSCFSYKFNFYNKHKHFQKKWLSWEDNVLKREYPHNSVKELAKRLNRTPFSIFHRTNRLGLTKCGARN